MLNTIGKRAVLGGIALAATCAAQNLVSNPGFEDGLNGWSTIWARQSGAATALVAAAPVHAGTGALRVQHSGTEDWSIQPQTGFPLAVLPGRIYAYSAWVRVDSLVSSGDVQLSLVLRDAAAEVTDWSYAQLSCSLSTGSYRQYTSRFLVPESAASIAPRLIGYDRCDVYADDFSLQLVDSLPATVLHPFILRNSQVEVVISPLSFVIDLHALSSTGHHITQPTGLFEPRSVDSTADSIVFHCTFVRGGWPCDIAVALEGPAVRITIHADSASVLDDDFVFPGPIPSADDGQIVLGKGTGLIMPASNVPSYLQGYRWHAFYSWQSDMSLVGVTDAALQRGYAIATADPWFTRAQMSAPMGSTANAPHIVHEPAKHQFGKPSRTLYYAAFDGGGYVAMAKWYRSVAEKHGWVRTFAEKTVQVPATERLKGAVDWWNTGSGFWSPRAGFYRELIEYGLDRAIVNGGMPDAMVDTLNDLGFLTSVYDIYCDAYPPGYPGYWNDGYNTDAIVNEDGSYALGWLAYLDSGVTLQAQEVCAASHARFAVPRVLDERTHRRLNCRFIDVELAIGLQECWSTVHPVNRWSDARCRVKLFDTLRTQFGLVLGGEQARDFAFPWVDYGEGTMSFSPADNAGYDWATPVAADTGFVSVNMNPAIHVPLHGLAYHDVHIPTWYTGDGVSKVPAYWDDKDLFNILYASMPLFMPPDTAYWRANFERFLTSYHLVSAVNRGVGFATMTGHTFLNTSRDVQRTQFGNGWAVTVNFGSTAAYDDGARTLPPKGFHAAGPGGEVYRQLSGTDRVAVARVSDRLFVNTYGTAVALHGVRSTGAVFLRCDTTSIHLAFIGPQQSVELNLLETPWQMANARAFTPSGTELPLEPVGSNWVRLARQPSVAFYRLEGAFAVRPATAPAGVLHSVRVRQLPGGRGLSVRWYQAAPGRARVDVYSVDGKHVAQGVARCSAGLSSMVLRDGPGAAGHYLVAVRTGGVESFAGVVVP